MTAADKARVAAPAGHRHVLRGAGHQEAAGRNPNRTSSEPVGKGTLADGGGRLAIPDSPAMG
jgi:hypothetical protein